ATSGAMAAMIGADENVLRALAADVDVDVANINAPGQIVISGERAKVETAIGMAKEHGIRRATLLNVAGAYHSRLMEMAYRKLGPEKCQSSRAKQSPAVSRRPSGYSRSTIRFGRRNFLACYCKSAWIRISKRRCVPGTRRNSASCACLNPP